MATVSSQVLSKLNLFDKVAISVDASDYEEKFGYFKIVINTVTWTYDSSNVATGEKLKLSIKAPQFTKDCDTALVEDSFDVTDAGVTPALDKFITSCNNGLVGPSAFYQGDNSVDLLHITTELDPFTLMEDCEVTVDYTLTFTEVDITTLGSTNVATGNAVLNVTDEKTSASQKISAKVEECGAYILVPQTLTTILNDAVAGDFSKEDSVPLFLMANIPTVNSYGQQYGLINHPVSKSSSSVKTYKKTAMVYAVNDSKIDANANNGKDSYVVAYTGSPTATETSVFDVAGVLLRKIQEWPCDDTVQSTINYKLKFCAE